MTKQNSENKTVLDKFVGKTIESFKLELSCVGGYCDLLTIHFEGGRNLRIQSMGDNESELWLEESPY